MGKTPFLKIAGWLCVIAAIILLDACSTVRKDGPPPFDVDVSKIPDATPKPEGKSKYGNMASYQVFGKTYHVMHTSRNYEARGIASWYGTKFHRHNTSSGEKYNMLAMTAAHKTLPLPTYVEVTNLRNGKKVIVKVNDRGPFESNRLIDLSYVAAKKLGMLGHGTAYVDVKAIDPLRFSDDPLYLAHDQRTRTTGHSQPQLAHNNHKRSVQFAQNTQTSNYHSDSYLQVGAFSKRENAERLKNNLAQKFHSPVVITRVMHTKRPLYHVNIGPLPDVASRQRISKRLRSLGLASKATHNLEA